MLRFTSMIQTLTLLAICSFASSHSDCKMLTWMQVLAGADWDQRRALPWDLDPCYTIRCNRTTCARVQDFIFAGWILDFQELIVILLWMSQEFQPPAFNKNSSSFKLEIRGRQIHAIGLRTEQETIARGRCSRKHRCHSINKRHKISCAWCCAWCCFVPMPGT